MQSNLRILAPAAGVEKYSLTKSDCDQFPVPAGGCTGSGWAGFAVS
jgi:hypothetical protein